MRVLASGLTPSAHARSRYVQQHGPAERHSNQRPPIMAQDAVGQIPKEIGSKNADRQVITPASATPQPQRRSGAGCPTTSMTDGPTTPNARKSPCAEGFNRQMGSAQPPGISELRSAELVDIHPIGSRKQGCSTAT